MDERTLFETFHEAFDIVPPAGGYDRMRTGLTKAPIALQRRHGFRLRNTKMAFRFAAGLAVVALAVMALLAFLALHRPPTSYVPVEDTRPYQTLVAKDYATTVASASNHCNTIQDKDCKAAYEKVRANLVLWLNDMNNFTPPARFKQIDSMLRHHLAQAMIEGDAGVAAQQAGNTVLFDTAFNAHFNERGLLDAIAGAVANTRVVSASSYKSIVKDQLDQYMSCTPCAKYPGPAALNCSGTQLHSCVDDVVAIDAQVYNFEATVVLDGAPPSLASKDTALQTDLVNADTALMAMITAGLSGNVAAFDAARVSLQIAISAVNQDAGAIARA